MIKTKEEFIRELEEVISFYSGSNNKSDTHVQTQLVANLNKVSNQEVKDLKPEVKGQIIAELLTKAITYS